LCLRHQPGEFPGHRTGRTPAQQCPGTAGAHRAAARRHGRPAAPVLIFLRGIFMSSLPSLSLELVPNPANPGRSRDEAYGARRSAVLGAPALALAERELTGWQGYAVTPLHS